MSDTWTIGELADRTARALRDGMAPPGDGRGNGRVRDVPGERLIRWYTTIGLVDPPLTRRGRIARYGRRHLLQLVAVKRLQAAGRSIAQIQAALAGATDRMLETTAALENTAVPKDTDGAADTTRPGEPERLRDTEKLGDTAGTGHPAAPAPPAAETSRTPRAAAGRRGERSELGDGTPDERARGRFWAAHPGTGAARDTETPTGGPGPRPGAAGVAGDTDRPSAGTRGNEGDARGLRRAGRAGHRAGAVVTGVVLGDGVRLVLDAGRAPSDEDVQAVLAAAGPLLAVLEERQLT
ncbi:MerR family transcriptional regulator [Nonomuraea diastatica]|uniref:MerR family transcriptional regulator n=1 Tax=Nonomuraea diastatica TaxID=1848329 RepID=UPI001C703618|nr:MerR family transcriptional regulator [Nonomuraea diastatica]